MTTILVMTGVWLLQSTVVLGAALVAARALARRVALAHAVIAAAILAVFALPALTWGAGRAGASLVSDAVWSRLGAGIAGGPQHAMDAGDLAARSPSSGSAHRAWSARAQPDSALAPPLDGAASIGAAAGDGTARALESAPAAGADSGARAGAAAGIVLRTIGLVLLAAWLATSGILLARLAWAIARMRRLRASCEPCDDRALATALASARSQLSVEARVSIWSSEVVTAPLICAWGRPMIIVPRLRPVGVDWTAVMRHELSHLIRRDHWTAVAAELLVAILPWHPCAHAARRRLAALAECACDDAAIERGGRAADYAASLLAFLPERRAARWTPAIVGTVGLAARIERVVSRRPGAGSPRRSMIVGSIAVLGGIVLVSCTAAAAGARPARSGEPVLAPKPGEPVPAPAESELAPKPGEPVPAPKPGEPVPAPRPREPVPAPAEGDAAADSGAPALAPGGTMAPAQDAGRQRARSEERPAAPVDLAAALEEIESIVLSPKRPLDRARLWELARKVDSLKDPRSIAPLVGLIAADETYDTVYGLGYFGLAKTTGVRYSPFHDGAWWKRWWLDHRGQYGEELAALEIPVLSALPSARAHVPFPEDLDTTEGRRRWLVNEFRAGDFEGLELSNIAGEIAEAKDLGAIPLMIGIIDADGTYETVYGVGYFGLGRMTGVEYSPFHDGAWWRRWWQRNRTKYPADVAAIPIPSFEKTAAGRRVAPLPESFETFEGKRAWFREAIESNRQVPVDDFATALARDRDPRAIPFLIALLDADPRPDAAYRLGHFALLEATGVAYEPSHDAAWWRGWLEENRLRLGLAGEDGAVPDLRNDMAAWWSRAAERERAAEAREPGAASSHRRAHDDDEMRYVEFGPRDGAAAPEKGWGVLLILPGGDGGPDFEPFCASIAKESVPSGFIAVELIAPRWSDDDSRVVWPTRFLNPQKARFTTETFIDEVVEDLGARWPIDRSRILALGWSSSGPALYADLLRPESPIRGRSIAMSVFRPQWFGHGASIEGRRVHLLHASDDALISIDAHARRAESRLRELGADVTLETCAGGHGWTDDPHGRIRRALEWLLR